MDGGARTTGVPLGFGHLSGKYIDDAEAAGRITAFPQFGQRYFKENVAPASRAYAELARAHGLTPAQLALAWVLGRRPHLSGTQP